jgi:hypothetical protein
MFLAFPDYEKYEMDYKAIKEATLSFYKAYHAEHGKAPSVKLAWSEVEGLTKRNFYDEIFKGGQAEACRLSGIPVPEDRIEATSRAREEREEAPRTPGKLEEEVQADEAEAALKVEKDKRAALERVRKADVEHLELEAMEDPEKVLPYLKSLEPKLTDPFLNLCKEAGLKPEKGIAEAVKKFKTWREYSHSVEEPDFKHYLKEMLDAWMSERRLKLALERHREDYYRLTCESCSLKYEYEFKEKGALLSCPNGCPTRDGYTSFFKLCLVCLDLGKENCLFYDPSSNVIYCKVCGHRAQVKDQPLKEKGTKKGTLKREVTDLEESKRALASELRGQQRQKLGEEQRIKELRQEGKRLETSVEETRQTLVEERRAYEAKKTELNNERAKLLRNIEELREENGIEKGKGAFFIAWSKFILNVETLSTEELTLIIRALIRAEGLRKEGKLGSALKLEEEGRDILIKKLAGGRYILLEEADKRREQELAQQRHKHEGEIEALRREHITEIKKQKIEYDHKIEEQRIEYEKKIKKLEGEVRRLEKELSSVRGPQSPPQRTSHMRLIKRGTP